MINKCVILANEDKVIQNLNGGKNLYTHKILGLTPLERIVLSAKENGIKNFCFVVNGEMQNIKESINEEELNVKTSFIKSDYDYQPDILSTEKLTSFIENDKFLLVKGNTVIDRKIYKELLSENSNDVNLNDILKESKASGTLKGFWQEINSESDIKIAEKKLLKSCIKEADSFLSRNFTRPISLFLSRYFSRTNITPNQITYLNLLVGIICAFLVASPVYFINLLGLLLFEFTVIFDGCDGEIARLKFKDSKRGAQIDTVIDFLTRVMFFTALGIVNLKFNQTYFDYFFSIATPILSAVTMIITVVLLIKYNIPDEGCFSAENMKFRDEAGPVKRFFGVLMKPEGFTTVFFLLGIFRLYRIMLVLAAIGYIGFTIYDIIIAVRTFRLRSVARG